MNDYNIKIKYRPEIFRIIFYIILYGIFGVLSFLFFRAYTSIIILVIFGILPVISMVELIYSSSKLQISTYISKDDSNSNLDYGIKINNKSIFSFLKVKLTIRVDNSFYDFSNKLKYIIALHYGENLQKLNLNVYRCGKIQICLENIDIYDICGLLKASVEVNDNSVIDILPNVLCDYEDNLHQVLLQGMTDNEDESRKGNEYSDTSNIREYIPGDRIKDIHWKLSAKRDLLLVRERIKSCENKIVLLLECNDNCEINDQILALFYTISLLCIKEGVLVKLYYYDNNLNDYIDINVGNIKELNDSFSEIYKCSNKNITKKSIVVPQTYIKVGLIMGQVGFEIVEGHNA